MGLSQSRQGAKVESVCRARWHPITYTLVTVFVRVGITPSLPFLSVFAPLREPKSARALT